MSQHEFDRLHMFIDPSQLEAARLSEHDLRVLVEVGRAVGAEPGLERVFDRVASIIGRVLPVDCLAVSLIDEAQGVVWNEYSFPEKAGDIPTRHRRPLAGTLIERLATTGDSCLFDESSIPSATKTFPTLKLVTDRGIRSGMLVPLFSLDRPVGVLHAGSTKSYAYGQRELAFLWNVASHMAGIAANAVSHIELEEQSRERDVFAEIGRILISSRDIRRTYERLAEQVRILVPFDRMKVRLIDAEARTVTNAFTSGKDPGPWAHGQAHPIEETTSALLLKTGRSILVDDSNRDEIISLAPNLGRSIDELPSMLAVPLVARGRIIAALQFQSREHNAFSSSDRAVAERVGVYVAGAVDNSRLYSDAQREAGQRSALAEMSRVINASADIEEVYPRFARVVARLIPWDRITINEVDMSRGTYTERYIEGMEVAGRDRGTVVSLEGSLTEKVSREKATVVIQDGSESSVVDSGLPGLLPLVSAGLKSLISVPLIFQEELIGTMHLCASEPHAYTARHRVLAEQVADQVVGALAMARLYDAARREAEERHVLASIAVAASRDLDLSRVFERMTGQISRLLAFDRIAVTLRDVEKKDGEDLVTMFARGDEILGFAVGSTVPGSGMWQWKATLGATPEVDEPGGSRRSAGLRSMVRVPLGTQAGGFIGFLSLLSRRDKAYDSSTLELLKRVALHVTPAIQNARAHEQALMLAGERERAAALQVQATELERVNEAKSQFLSTVSHELRTPLTSVCAFADILVRNRDGNLTEQQIQRIKVIRRNGTRLAMLITDLLDLSQIDSGNLRLNVARFDAREVLTDLAESFDPIIEQKQQILRYAIPGQPIMLHGDRDRLSQVISNLLTNAVKYSPEKTEIELVATVEDERLQVAVTDHGIGISEGDQSQLFTMFFRVDNEPTRAVSGTGLGLYIARQIVQMHDGDIAVTSREGQGTTVSFWIPLAGADSLSADGTAA
ncbi:MAG: GAF domain-containing protein [Dehalococcoidia bacterium]